MPGCDGIYRERAHLLALLATHYEAYMQTDQDSPAWPVLYLLLPTGQATWHISAADLDLFAHVPVIPHLTWDGHTTDEKYERVDKLTHLRSQKAA